MKDKTHYPTEIVISIDAEKFLTKFNTFMIKTLDKLGREGMYFKIIKNIDDKLTANIVLNGEKLKIFLLSLGTRKRYPLLPLLFKIVLKVQARGIRQEKEVKSYKLEKNE